MLPPPTLASSQRKNGVRWLVLFLLLFFHHFVLHRRVEAGAGVSKLIRFSIGRCCLFLKLARSARFSADFLRLRRHVTKCVVVSLAPPTSLDPLFLFFSFEIKRRFSLLCLDLFCSLTQHSRLDFLSFFLETIFFGCRVFSSPFFLLLLSFFFVLETSPHPPPPRAHFRFFFANKQKNKEDEKIVSHLLLLPCACWIALFSVCWSVVVVSTFFSALNIGLAVGDNHAPPTPPPAPYVSVLWSNR